MDKFLVLTVTGLCTAGVFAIGASGLVLTYTTTGIFNFAHGAIGMLGAFAYWQLLEWGVPTGLAVAIVLLAVAPALGAVIDLGIMRGLETASEMARLVVSVAMLAAALGLGIWLWPPDVGRPLDLFFPDEHVRIAGVNVSWHELLALVLAVVVAVGLRLLLYNSRAGITMRAVVDDRSLALLNGARPDRSSLLAWSIGCSLAALAGILVAAQQGLTHLPLTLLIVNAYAAAMLGRLRSLPADVPRARSPRSARRLRRRVPAVGQRLPVGVPARHPGPRPVPRAPRAPVGAAACRRHATPRRGPPHRVAVGPPARRRRRARCRRPGRRVDRGRRRASGAGRGPGDHRPVAGAARRLGRAAVPLPDELRGDRRHGVRAPRRGRQPVGAARRRGRRRRRRRPRGAARAAPVGHRARPGHGRLRRDPRPVGVHVADLPRRAVVDQLLRPGARCSSTGSPCRGRARSRTGASCSSSGSPSPSPTSGSSPCAGRGSATG